VSLSETNHADTLMWMIKMAEATGQGPGDMRRDPECDVFLRTPQYREWLDWAAMHKRD
jgi:hypothetical protein